MVNIFSTKLDSNDKKAVFALVFLVLVFVILTLVQDFLRSDINNSAFYLSESLLFSSFWWLFTPLLFVQYFALKKNYQRWLEIRIAVFILPIFVHLFAFPLLVWVFSRLFYYHTFSFEQTFWFTLSEHLYPLVLIYPILGLFTMYYLKKEKDGSILQKTGDVGVFEPLSSILVSDKNKKQIVVIEEVLYFSANPPYTNVYIEGKKYLCNETLKSILIKINKEQFIRIHRSTVVNIKMVKCYTSRHNGDYDVTLNNNIQLRVSRNYASEFKNLLSGISTSSDHKNNTT